MFDDISSDDDISSYELLRPSKIIKSDKEFKRISRDKVLCFKKDEWNVKHQLHFMIQQK